MIRIISFLLFSWNSISLNSSCKKILHPINVSLLNPIRKTSWDDDRNSKPELAKEIWKEKKRKEREREKQKKGERRWWTRRYQRKRKGILRDVEQSLSSLLVLHPCLLSLKLTIVGSTISVEAPMRYLCVRFWQVLQRKHLICLKAKKLAPWTHLSHFLQRKALSAWQYKDAWDPQSSQQTKLEVSLPEPASSSSCFLQNLPWLWLLSSTPLHILIPFPMEIFQEIGGRK